MSRSKEYKFLFELKNYDVFTLKAFADQAKGLYNRGDIGREEAKSVIRPYIKAFNRRAIFLAKKHGVKPKKLNIVKYLR